MAKLIQLIVKGLIWSCPYRCIHRNPSMDGHENYQKKIKINEVIPETPIQISLNIFLIYKLQN